MSGVLHNAQILQAHIVMLKFREQEPWFSQIDRQLQCPDLIPAQNRWDDLKKDFRMYNSPIVIQDVRVHKFQETLPLQMKSKIIQQNVSVWIYFLARQHNITRLRAPVKNKINYFSNRATQMWEKGGCFHVMAGLCVTSSVVSCYDTCFCPEGESVIILQ